MSLKETGKDIFSNFLNQAQGVATELASDSIRKLVQATPKELIAERQKIDAINGSGAPSTHEALKVTSGQGDFAFGDPVNRSLATSSNVILFVAIGLIAFFVWKGK